MNHIIFISLLFLSLCVPHVAEAQRVSAQTDSLYRIAQKERTFSTYGNVLEHMLSKEESGEIYENSLDAITSIANQDTNELRNAIVLKYRAFHRRHNGDNDGFVSDLTEARKLFNKARNLNGETDVIGSLASYYLYIDRDKSVALLEEGLQLLNDTVTVKKASMLNTLSIIKYYKGDTDAGIDGFKQVLAMLDQCNETQPLPSMAQNIAALYSSKEMYDSAAFYYEKALGYCEMTGNHNPEPNIYSNLAALYTKVDLYDEAMKYADKAVEAAHRKADNWMNLTQAYHVRAGVSKALKNMTSAKADFRMALEAAQKTNSPQLMLKPIPGLMSAYRSEGNTDSVVILSELGGKYAQMINEPTPEVANFYEVRAEYLASIGNSAGSLKDLLWLRNHRKSTMPAKELLGRIGRDYMAIGDFRQASLYLDSACIASDSLFNREMKEALAKWDAKFENQEKQIEIDRMENERLRFIFWLVTAIIVLVLLCVAIFAQRRSLKRKIELEAARKYVEGLESERSRISKELHDGVCNDLLGVQLLAETAYDQTGMNEMLEYLERTREEARRISHDLASPSLERTSFEEMTQVFVERLAKGAGRIINFSCELSCEPSQEVSANLYRIIQELTANAVKHSSCGPISVVINGDSEKLHICVKSPATVRQNDKPGIGMISVQNRVKTLNGKISTESDDSCNYTKIDI